MTDYKQLCEDLGKPIETMDELDQIDIMAQAASAIEELQAENERLKKQLGKGW